MRFGSFSWPGASARRCRHLPTFTFCATAEVVALCGATPVMADVDADTFNLDPASCERAVATAKRRGLKPRAIIPVDLFGLPADHDAIAAIAAASTAC